MKQISLPIAAAKGCALFLLAAAAATAEINVLCTTFPIYQIARNVVQGHTGTRVELLLPAALGCPHHYSLTPQDLVKLAQSDVLVVNGLGMEEFLGAPVKQANPRLFAVDSANGVEALLPMTPLTDSLETDAHACHDDGTRAGAPVPPTPADMCAHAHDHAHDAEHAAPPHAQPNPHLFASPRMAAVLAENIAAGLSKADPEGASVYFKNAKAYAGRMTALADEMAAAVKTLRNNRIVQPHGVFDYLARDIGLEVVAVTQPHGQAPSAAEMLALVARIRAGRAGVVLTEPQYSPKVGQTLAREAGIPSAVLDPGASGPTDAPLDYYEQVMRQNMATLRATLGSVTHAPTAQPAR